jgi:VIT1/CCC1 family predicted Fe2+/Mn2+ transporter
VSDEARDRLLQAWRGEIVAGRVYDLISRRMPPREADILHRMAQAEGSHRQRIEQRMNELGIPIPDEGSVKLSPWLRLQTRVAPIDRLLAAREAAEDEEVDDLYKRSTGDASTDRLLREIRKEERSHARTVQDMRSGDGRGPDPAPIGVPGAQARLEKILSRESGHSTGTGWVSAAIYGANDGLAAVFGIVAGVSSATSGSSFVLTAGLSGAIASALSMATGAFLAERSESEMMEANLARERQEIAEHPEEEKEELSLYYQLKGIDEKTADELAERMSKHPEAMLQALAAEEFGKVDSSGNPVQSAAAAGISTGVGAIIPVIPFFFTTGAVATILAAIISLVAHFLVGAAKSLVTLRSWWSAGLEMTLAGAIVGGAMYLIGLAIPT